MKKIDIHCHTSIHKLWGLHTAEAGLAALEKLTLEHDIVKTVLIATYFPFKGSGLKNAELLNRIRGHKQFLVFGSLDAMNDLENGLKELAVLAKQKLIAGIKLYPGYQDFRASDEKIFPVYGLARQYGLPVMFHTGELHHCCPKEKREKKEYRCGSFCRIDRLGDLSRPREMKIAARNFPEVKFILSHLGNPYFVELRELMAECPNVYTDISGQFISGHPEEDTPEYKEKINQELKKFLAAPEAENRIMFGTDFPIQSHADSVALVESLGLGDDVKQKIYYDNARVLLNLQEEKI